MKNRNRVVVCLLLFTIINAFGQPGTQWEKTFDLGEDENFREFISLPEGGFAFAGYSRVNQEDNFDFFLIRLDENGDSLWADTYGGAGSDFCQTVCSAEDGGFLLAGRTRPPNGSSRSFVMRVNMDGDSLWSREFAFSGITTTLQVDDGGFVLFGDRTVSSEPEDDDFVLAKIDSEGGLLWTHSYGTEYIEAPGSAFRTSDGGFVLMGYSRNPENDDTRYYLVKTNEEGERIWSRRYVTENGWFYGNNALQHTEGGLLLTGNATLEQDNLQYFWIICADEEGDVVWERSFLNEQAKSFSEVLCTADGGFLLGGTSHVEDRYDFILEKVNSNWETEWSQTFGTDFQEQRLQLSQETNREFGAGSFFLAGEFPNGRDNGDLILIKTETDPMPPSDFALLEPANGDTMMGDSICFIWERSVDPNPEDAITYILNISLESDSLEFQAGDTTLTVASTNLVDLNQEQVFIEWRVLSTSDGDTVECSERFRFILDNPSKVLKDHQKTPAIFSLSPPFPNPFNSTTTITFSVSPHAIAGGVGGVSLRIYDLSGRLVTDLLNRRGVLQYAPTAGTHKVVWEAKDLGAGVYFVRLEAGSEVSTKKVVLIR